MNGRKWTSCGLLLAAVVAVLGGRPVQAQTCSLEMKYLEASPNPFGFNLGEDEIPVELLLMMVRPQQFTFQSGDETNGPDPRRELFASVITMEPEYESDAPLRDVCHLGDHRIGFALDSSKGGKGYDRLYFDLNRDGDLTNDGPVKADSPSGFFFSGDGSSSLFPLVAVEIEAGGTPLQYAFRFTVNDYTFGDAEMFSVALTSAAYREGEIELNGKTRHLLLADFDANGRFDDRMEIGRTSETGGRIWRSAGDVLYIDGQDASTDELFDVESTMGGHRHSLSGLLSIEGGFYDVKVSPAGDELTLSASEVALGHVTNEIAPWRATVYGERGILDVVASDDGHATLPEGEWHLLSYAIDRTEQWKEKPAERKRSVLERLGDMFGESEPVSGKTRVAARLQKAGPAVKVVAGETVGFHFGPPYKGVVKAGRGRKEGEVRLSLSIVGAVGEECTDLLLNGKRPSDPAFVIMAPDGEIVKRGKFEYG